MKYIKYYITPILAPTVIIGIFLGGHWMWLGLAVLIVVVMEGMQFLDSLEHARGLDEHELHQQQVRFVRACQDPTLLEAERQLRLARFASQF